MTPASVCFASPQGVRARPPAPSADGPAAPIRHRGRRAWLLAALAVGATALLAAPGAQAQAWPDRQIRLVVPFPPGGLIDNMARLIAPRLSAELGQPVVIDNRPGAGGNIGAAEAARADADGYTLLMASPPMAISPALYPRLPYDPAALKGVARLGIVPNVLLVQPAGGIDSVQALVAKARSAPGQLNYASNGNGTSLHLSAELFKAQTQTFIVHIPYRGAAAAQVGLIAGEVAMMFDNLPSAIGQVRAGTVKALAVTTAERSPALPDVPTLKESGLPEFEVAAFFGVAAPTGTPAAVVQRLEQALQRIAAEPEIAQAMQRSGAMVSFLGAADFGQALMRETAAWRGVVERANIRMQ
jgi:tripartite-type tricarboxylate transporter receptor subunit TctC